MDKKFILNNNKRANIIINNKEYKLKENLDNRELNTEYLIKIKFLDNIIYLNSMFKGCKSLSHIYKFQNLNTKYLKTIYCLFYGCDSLKYKDDSNLESLSGI